MFLFGLSNFYGLCLGCLLSLFFLVNRSLKTLLWRGEKKLKHP